MAQTCEAYLADFILNVHETFTGDLATVKKSLEQFYSGCNVELDSKSKKIVVDDLEVGTFTLSGSGTAKPAAGAPKKRKSAGKAKTTTAPQSVTAPGENAPAESQPSGPGGSNESEKA